MKNKFLIILKLMFVLVLLVQIGTAAVNISVSAVYKGDTSTSITNSVMNGDILYIGQGTIFSIVNIKDNTNPTEISKLGISSKINNLDIVGDYVYLACDNGLYIVDISTPSSPFIIGSYNSLQSINAVSILDNSAYITVGQNGFNVLNIYKKDNPTLRGSVDTSGIAENLVLSMFRANPDDCPCFDRTYAYIADGDNGLVLIDAHPSFGDPTIKGTYDTLGHAYDVAISNNYAYVADGNNGLVILDITTPTSPVLVATYNNIFARNIELSGNYVYIASGNEGLHIFDIINPSNPILVGTYNSGSYVHDILPSGDQIYLSDANNGIIILNTNETNVLAPTVTSNPRLSGENVAVFDPNTATWAIGNHGDPSDPFIFSLGSIGNSIPIVGDWNGDGRSESGIYNIQENYFLIRSSDGDNQINLGWDGVRPVAGDWNNDGKDEVGVFDPNSATWALGDPNNPVITQLGSANNSIPIVGDWDGDGSDNIGVYNIEENYFLIRSSDGDNQINLGWDGVRPVAGDWNNDGKDEVGVFDPNSATWALGDPNNPVITQLRPVISGIPVVGDWDDDGSDNIGIYDNQANHFILRNGNEDVQINLGWNNVIPLSGRC